MKTFEFTKEINAPAEKVWETLWNKSTYSQWTSAFTPEGKCIVQSDWEVGGKTFFLDDKGSGLVSTIKSKNEPYEIVFQHLGEVKDGVEDTTSDDVKAWAGNNESYFLTENNGITTLRAVAHASEEWAEMMTKGFEFGLEEVKKLSEK
ncbi:MAG: SRPBCC domain-containing protein [Bacteroidota bacterium]|nr:SRPBCC domain-containing protein [Bacteroidota bacterium]